MSIIDRQRIEAVKLLEANGYTFSLEHGWTGGTIAPFGIGAADTMCALLMRRADALAGCTEAPEEAELAAIAVGGRG